jgi:hypothetical protein
MRKGNRLLTQLDQPPIIRVKAKSAQMLIKYAIVFAVLVFRLGNGHEFNVLGKTLGHGLLGGSGRAKT